MNTKTYAGRLTARLFLCSKSAYTNNRISGGLFSENVTIKTLRFFRLSSFLCSTVKSRSKREKLSLKTLIMPRVRLAIESGSFFIYATILSFFVDFGDCDFNSHLRLLFSVLLRLCRKANKKNGGISKMKKVVILYEISEKLHHYFLLIN